MSSQGPTNETSAQVLLDIADVNGGDLAFVAYGVHATLYFLCLTLLLEERKKNRRATWGWIAYITMLFILGSIGNGANMFLQQDAFVNHRNYPGGPGQFEIDEYALTYNAVCTIAYIVGTWFADGLLIYRFYTILGTSLWIMVLPLAMYLTSIIMSILLLHQLVSPGGTLWVPGSINFALAYWSLSIAINLMLTLGIVGFLLYMRLRLRRVMGSQHVSSYLTVSAMLTESALLYTVFALVFLIPLARNNSVNLIFFQALGQVQFIAPLLIILRVAQGRALTRQRIDETMRTILTNDSGPMRFDSSGGQTTFNSTSLNTATIGFPQTHYSTRNKSSAGISEGTIRIDDHDVEMLAYRVKESGSAHEIHVV